VDNVSKKKNSIRRQLPSTSVSNQGHSTVGIRDEAEAQTLRRRLIYLRGRVPDITVERQRIYAEVAMTLEALKTLANNTEAKKAAQVRVSYLRQRLVVLKDEWLTLVAEHHGAVKRLSAARISLAGRLSD
jgi:hypothetical protein